MPGSENTFVGISNFAKMFKDISTKGSDAYFFWIAFRNNTKTINKVIPTARKGKTANHCFRPLENLSDKGFFITDTFPGCFLSPYKQFPQARKPVEICFIFLEL